MYKRKKMIYCLFAKCYTHDLAWDLFFVYTEELSALGYCVYGSDSFVFFAGME